ncbi:MAG: hypothetical protein JWN16_2799 [Alphaproteobacteria bacterium]|nr:hypothetical protein [Alphaproteobacteria bacterium]
MPDKALQALKEAYQHHVEWMQTHAEQLETGKAQHLEQDRGMVVNKSTELAEEFRYRANNLHALILAYEALASKSSS